MIRRIVITLTLLILSLPLILLTIDWVRSYGTVGELTIGWRADPRADGSRTGRMLAGMSQAGRAQVTAVHYTDSGVRSRGQPSVLEAYEPAEGERTIFLLDSYPSTEPMPADEPAFKWEPLTTNTLGITLDGRIVRFPHWLAAIVLALPPLPLLLRIRRRFVRKKRGLCLACGYDLRASTGVCPECGQAIGTAAR